MKKICVVTSTRADYGILLPLLRRICEDGELELKLAVTGTHLEAEHGMTVTEIETDGIPIAVRIPILSGGDTAGAVSQTMADALCRFSAYFEQDRPDMAVVLGDRYEIFAVCAALVSARIPIAHLHGGETTEGAVDECFRHSITKMSYLHFTANELYRRRVIQLGEAPRRVFNVGALSIENAINTEFLPRETLLGGVGLRPELPYSVVTFHPVTLEGEEEAKKACDALLAAMNMHPGLQYLCTRANADACGRLINGMLERHAASRENCVLVPSLGMRRYMSALKYAQFVLGNSSSGIIEAPAFHIPTVNIGDRQRGRMLSQSVISCPADAGAIAAAMETAMSGEFRMRAQAAPPLFGDGHTSGRICAIIKEWLVGGNIDLKKNFYDIAFDKSI